MHVQDADEEEGDTEERDVYDKILTKTEIQEGVNGVNTAVKMEEAEEKSMPITSQ